MKTHEAARRTLAKVLREYYNDDETMPSQKFRDIVYGLAVLLQYFKLEADLSIEKRLDEIEAVLSEVKE